MQIDQPANRLRRARASWHGGAAALCLALGLTGPAFAVDKIPCRGPCVVVPTSVVHAAGVPGLRDVVKAIDFTGDALAPDSKEAVAKLAAAVKAAPEKFVLHATVGSQKGLEAQAAAKQRKARAAALSAALVEAGVPAKKLSIRAGN